jgi:hypothetical protein
VASADAAPRLKINAGENPLLSPLLIASIVTGPTGAANEIPKRIFWRIFTILKFNKL